MVTQAEETQAKEFLKRAEIRTMKKDLRALRETDALKERDKITKIRTLEEQKLDQEKKLQEIEEAKNEAAKTGLEKVLGQNAKQERIAEKDLKLYASEQERQQIFLLESQRLGFENNILDIDNKKDPALKLEKNKILLEKRDQETKLNSILADEKKLEDEQKFIAEKAKITNIASERKSLEQRRWDIDKDIQEIEKKRWAVEKQIETVESKIKEIDKSSEQNVAEKNNLNQKVLGIEKSLREIYGAVIAKVEEKRLGQAEEQRATREVVAKIKAGENERIQREQRTHTANPVQGTGKEFMVKVPLPPVPHKAKNPSTGPSISKYQAEEEQRKKFMKDVEQATQTGGQQQEKSNIK
jgi:hypothetical protein